MESPRPYRRLRKASDLRSAHSSERVSMSQKAVDDEDMISRLPDDILIMILSKMDARAAMVTTILSKRWHSLPQLHTCYDLDVNDILPRRYHRQKRLYGEAKAGYEAEKCEDRLTDICAIRERHKQWMGRIMSLRASLEHYKRCAMRRYVKLVNAFLLVPKSARKCRSIQKLRLQTFGSNSRYWIDQWIIAAITKWKVEDLSLAAVDHGVFNFKHLNGRQKVRLNSLSLSNWIAVGIHKSPVFRRLTKLSLSNLSCMGETGSILRHCIQIKDLRITACCITVDQPVFQIDAPRSKIKNLQVEDCNFVKLYLFSLPCLETLVCRGQPTKIHYGNVPQLKHLSLNYLQPETIKDNLTSSNKVYPLKKFFKRIPPLENLVLQFKGTQMWVEQTPIPSWFRHLNRLFVANVPVEWDIFWILFLLDAAPVLEMLHVHIGSPGKEATGEVCKGIDAEHLQYSNLKEFTVIGFHGARTQIGLVRQVMKLSPELMHVHLLDGNVKEDERGLGNLEIIQYRSQWHECERAEIVDELTDGTRSGALVVLE
uniref:Uncharacterized protein n=1 Tax=Avena sativa TaxID=4498 RepID=A0ACD5VIM2_AVESA